MGFSFHYHSEQSVKHSTTRHCATVRLPTVHASERSSSERFIRYKSRILASISAVLRSAWDFTSAQVVRGLEVNPKSAFISFSENPSVCARLMNRMRLKWSALYWREAGPERGGWASRPFRS